MDFLFHVLRYGAECEVLAPEALREQVAAEAARMASLYEGTG